MAKFSGKIGFGVTTETNRGVWKEEIVERPYRGDLLRDYQSFKGTNSVNDNIDISNQVSIVADRFAFENFYAMKYVIFANAKWKITSVEVQRPRLILSIGGLYNG